MQLGHAHGDRRHHGHVRIAANGLAAVAVIRQQLRLIADADLPQLDPPLKFPGQVFDQLAEVHALFRQEVKDNPLAAEQVLDVHQLHLKLAVFDETAAGLHFLPFGFLEAIQLLTIIRGDEAKNLPVRRLRKQLDDLRLGLREHLSDFLAALAANDDCRPPAVRSLAGRLEFAEKAHHPVANDIFRGHRLNPWWNGNDKLSPV